MYSPFGFVSKAREATWKWAAQMGEVQYHVRKHAAVF